MEACDADEMQFLRLHGWTLKSRPGRYVAEPVWENRIGRLEMKQADAVNFVQRYLRRFKKEK